MKDTGAGDGVGSETVRKLRSKEGGLPRRNCEMGKGGTRFVQESVAKFKGTSGSERRKWMQDFLETGAHPEVSASFTRGCNSACESAVLHSIIVLTII